MSESIYTEYFQIAQENTQRYGEKTVLLMQVGAFFEIYGISPQTHLPSYKYRIFDVCKICDLNVSEKKTTFEGSALYMAGFRDFTSEKYIQRLVQASYTVVVYVQEKNEKNTRRIFHAVYSPGTYLPFEADAGVQLTNHIMCIWIETFSSIYRCSPLSPQDVPKSIIYGVAISNIYTGKSAMFEHQMPYVLNTTTFDELERLVAVYSPSEVILCSDLGENAVSQIIQFAGIRTHTIHQVRLDEQKR